eukprot:CAMPEP_0202395150 /NCGR_PEP_ID=MMETSP1127-20130417/93819_1 /ASSEMBLY_ACC=CAM_ASM_000462 /TAXON_ID=3047 /ORGANISM="Dunaliella tertiolecta, Strain CCMP1320" /LENGTH=74 /DNA_ID=CAMNT_0048997835 /DNA_START=628 /DNA_END=853 /DNA_ORIENTATION=+
MGSDAKMRSKMSGPAPPNGKPPENPPPMPPMPPKPPASSKPPPCSMRSMFSAQHGRTSVVFQGLSELHMLFVPQ